MCVQATKCVAYLQSTQKIPSMAARRPRVKADYADAKYDGEEEYDGKSDNEEEDPGLDLLARVYFAENRLGTYATHPLQPEVPTERYVAAVRELAAARRYQLPVLASSEPKTKIDKWQSETAVVNVLANALKGLGFRRASSNRARNIYHFDAAFKKHNIKSINDAYIIDALERFDAFHKGEQRRVQDERLAAQRRQDEELRLYQQEVYRRREEENRIRQQEAYEAYMRERELEARDRREQRDRREARRAPRRVRDPNPLNAFAPYYHDDSSKSAGGGRRARHPRRRSKSGPRRR
jgi:hypothetical protein